MQNIFTPLKITDDLIEFKCDIAIYREIVSNPESVQIMEYLEATSIEQSTQVALTHE
jgi:hypothetical protein